MKKLIFLLLPLLLLCPLASCQKEEEVTTEEQITLSPLFRFQVAEGKSCDTVIQYLPLSQGFFYLHPGETGFIAGFVSPARSLSAENLITGEERSFFVRVIETDADRALVLTEKKAYLAFFKEGRAKELPLHKDVDYSHAVSYDGLHLLAETKDLLVLQSVTMETPQVLARKAEIPEFSHFLTTTAKGDYLWYARKNADGYCGIGCFEFGEDEPFQEENFTFDRVQTVGEGKLLFTCLNEDGSARYVYRDLAARTAAEFTAPTPFDGVTCDPKGETLAGTRSEGDGGYVEAYRFADDKAVFSYHSEYGNPAPSLAFNEDGSLLLVALGKGKDELLGTFSLLK